MKLRVEENPSELVSEAGNSNILKSLWFPTSTSPTQKSGQIVSGCASLLGEHWDFSFGGILKLREWGVNVCVCVCVCGFFAFLFFVVKK